MQEDHRSSMGKLDETSIRSSLEMIGEHSFNKGDFKNYKVPIINWAVTPVYAYFIKHKKQAHILPAELQLYTEGEVDYNLDILKSRFDEFQRSDIMEPIFEKALLTLKYLLFEQTLDPIFFRVVETYS